MNKLAKVMSLVEMLKGDKSVPIPLCHRLRSEGCALIKCPLNSLVMMIVAV